MGIRRDVGRLCQGAQGPGLAPHLLATEYPLAALPGADAGGNQVAIGPEQQFFQIVMITGEQVGKKGNGGLMGRIPGERRGAVGLAKCDDMILGVLPLVASDIGIIIQGNRQVGIDVPVVGGIRTAGIAICQHAVIGARIATDQVAGGPAWQRPDSFVGAGFRHIVVDFDVAHGRILDLALLLEHIFGDGEFGVVMRHGLCSLKVARVMAGIDAGLLAPPKDLVPASVPVMGKSGQAVNLGPANQYAHIIGEVARVRHIGPVVLDDDIHAHALQALVGTYVETRHQMWMHGAICRSEGAAEHKLRYQRPLEPPPAAVGQQCITCRGRIDGAIQGQLDDGVERGCQQLRCADGRAIHGRVGSHDLRRKRLPGTQCRQACRNDRMAQGAVGVDGLAVHLGR